MQGLIPMGLNTTTMAPSNNKEVISPAPTLSIQSSTSPTSAKNITSSSGHNRSNSSPSVVPNDLSNPVPLVRSRTAPSQPLLLPPQENNVPQQHLLEQIDSTHNTSMDHHEWSAWQTQQFPLSGSPPRHPPLASHFQDPSDPDSEEQALFEQRLCEDVYGVAVRKINQNGKSNLRYVKCLYADGAAENNLPPEHNEPHGPQHHTTTGSVSNRSVSNRSVSSRHSRASSRVSLSRFLEKVGGSSSHHHDHVSLDHDAHQSLLRESGSVHRVRVLAWGKKKDVTVPLHKFTAVMKGKVNDRTKRNTCDASRVLSLVTSELDGLGNLLNPNHSISLDIEAPTRLDRDKFAKAFARFLNVPLYEERDHSIIRVANTPPVSTAFPHPHYQTITTTDRSIANRSIRSDLTPQSWHKDPPLPPTSTNKNANNVIRPSIASSVGNDHSIPDIALTTSNSINTNEKNGPTSGSQHNRTSGWKQLNAPLPVVTTRGPAKAIPAKNSASKPPRSHRWSTTSGGSSHNNNNAAAAASGIAPPPIHPGIVAAAVNSFNANNNANNNNPKIIQHISLNGGSNHTGSDASDPPLASLPSSSRSRTSLNNNNNSSNGNANNLHTITSSSNNNVNKGKMVLEIPVSTKSKLSLKSNSHSNHASSTPATSAISSHFQPKSTTPITPATDPTTNHNFDDDDDVVHHKASAHSNANNTSRDTNTLDNSDEMNEASVVSSITGVGFDQDLVEELHLALERMKVELQESRAEASRAVKVAEQAIQSAENSSSKDWNNTVTHKAAEAAAAAQKKSAEAMSKARIAEERLEAEKKNAVKRKKQVEVAEQQAAHWQTRAAAAEVQRFAVAEALESERKKNRDLMLRAAEQSWPASSQTDASEEAQALENERKKHQDLLFQASQAIASSSATKPPLPPPPLHESASPEASTKPQSSPLSSPSSRVDVDAIITDLEVDRLRSKLAMESARRRKLLDELQDLRGSIRVYCRLQELPPAPVVTDTPPPIVDMISNEVLMLHRDRSLAFQQEYKDITMTGKSSSSVTTLNPLCFDFDGILASDAGQQDVYAEFEAICASVVEGFKICLMSYGQANAGKTHTMLGDVRCKQHPELPTRVSIENEGIHLRAMKQLFSLIDHRKGQFQDTVTMTLVEVNDEKLIDLLAGTDFGEAHGRVETRKSSRKSMAEDTKSPPRKPSDKQPKLEIKTNRDGETVVRGVLSVDLTSYEDVMNVWTQSLAKRSSRLVEQKVQDPAAYESESHVVATVRVSSKNASTGAIASGRIQFVDFAASDITRKKPLGSSLSPKSSKRLLSLSPSGPSSTASPEHLLDDCWKFTNKSLNTVREVILARSQFQRSVPYRHSTITHILSDSLEADTKVVFVACVSSQESEAQNTACTLQLAQEMRKVVVGKATRHTTIANTSTHTSGGNHSDPQEI